MSAILFLDSGAGGKRIARPAVFHRNFLDTGARDVGRRFSRYGIADNKKEKQKTKKKNKGKKQKGRVTMERAPAVESDFLDGREPGII